MNMIGHSISSSLFVEQVVAQTLRSGLFLLRHVHCGAAVLAGAQIFVLMKPVDDRWQLCYDVLQREELFV